MGQWEIDVAKGGLNSHIKSVNKFGRNPDVDAGTEDIWSQGGTWVAPTLARVHAIVSSSANDAGSGTGARTISIEGLNGSYAEVSETLTLTGTVAVNTVNSYTIIHRIVVLTAGSGGANAGTITATAAVDATVSCGIVIGKNQTQTAIYQIPAGYSGYLSSFSGSYNGGGTSNVLLELFIKPFGGVFNLKGSVNLAESGSSIARRTYDTPLVIAAKSIIKLTATSDSANSDVVANFDLILSV